MNVVSSYPLWYFIFCVVLGAVLAFLLYRKDKKLVEFSKLTIAVLSSLRFLCITFLAVLLLSPLIKYFSKTVEKPIIVIAQDNSASMLMGKDSVFVKEQLGKDLAALRDQLGKSYEVEGFTFSEELNQLEKVAQFNGRLSNFDVLFDDLSNRYANRNVGGLILVSDGIYNEGSNPTYTAGNLDFPIFSVPVGDTTKYVDARVQNLRSNKLAFLGNEFPVEFDVRFQEAKEKKVRVSIVNGGKQVFSKELELTAPNKTLTVKAILKADQIGKQRYTVRVEKLADERNTLNNSRNFYIEILDGRQKIALLGMAPHPDLGVIKRSISANENYEVESGLLEDFKLNVKSYDLIILHQSGGKGNASLNPKFQAILKAEVPLFVIGGGWEGLEKQFKLPTNKSRRVINNQAQGIVNKQFNLFTLNQQLTGQLESFPPMNVSISQVNGNANKTLLTQKLGSVSTKYPLLSFYDVSNRKIARLYGEGLWRWSMMSYLANKSHQNFKQFIGKVIQFLAIKADRSFFRVNTDNEVFENESVNFNALLFNPSYELVNEEEVGLRITDEAGKEFDYIFSRTTKDYQLKVASLPPGTYTYNARVNFQGKQNRATGSFTIKELQLEKLNAEANYNLMYQIAAKSGGELIAPTELNRLTELFKSRKDITSVSYINEEVEDIINLKWIFFLLMALLTLEWFIRKRSGAY